MHFRKMNHHFPTCLFQLSIAGCRSLSRQFRAEGGNPMKVGSIIFHHSVHHTLHTQSDWGQCRHASSCNMHFLGYERKTEYLEKTQADVPALHRLWPWLGIDFFFLINVMKRCLLKGSYLRTCCTSSDKIRNTVDIKYVYRGYK